MVNKNLALRNVCFSYTDLACLTRLKQLRGNGARFFQDKWFVFVFAAILFIGWSPNRIWADTTPPVTTVALQGTLGQNGWYQSSVQVTLTTTDTESGPDKTYYWLNADPPTVIDHVSASVEQFSNNSFEQGSFSNVKDWYAGLYGLALYYQSRVTAYDGNKSAAIAFIGYSGDFYHWHNQTKSVAVVSGQAIQVSAWVRTVTIAGQASYFEIWGEDSSGGNDQLIATSPLVDGFNWNWQRLTTLIVVPTGVAQIYVKLGSTAVPAGIVYWDMVEVGAAQQEFSTLFTVAAEGNQTLHYYSKDNDGNVEGAHTVAIKKDTVAPNPWQTFTSGRSGCDHCYIASSQVRDVTSGIDVSTAEYRYYTEHNLQYWGNWQTVSSVKIAGTQQPASDGETGFVTLSTPVIDFGDSSPGPWRVQFRVYDMAGNLSTSPVYEIAAPWVVTTDGAIYIGGEISLPTPPTGESVAHADVAVGTGVAQISSVTGWIVRNYAHAATTVISLSAVLPNYSKIKSSAVPLPSGVLPSANGIYTQNGDFTIAANTMGGFETATVSAVVIVTGNLYIEKGYTVSAGNHTVFIVEGDLLVKQNVEEMAGFFIAQGQFDSDVSGKTKKSLTVNGSVVALTGVSVSRDLGSSGTPNNSTTAGEKFIWNPAFILDPVLSGYLQTEDVKYTWQEVEGGN